MSNETLTFTIDKKKIKADHQYADDTGRAFKDQKEGADQLKAFIRDQVVFQNKYPLKILLYTNECRYSKIAGTVTLEGKTDTTS